MCVVSSPKTKTRMDCRLLVKEPIAKIATKKEPPFQVKKIVVDLNSFLAVAVGVAMALAVFFLVLVLLSTHVGRLSDLPYSIFNFCKANSSKKR